MIQSYRTVLYCTGSWCAKEKKSRRQTHIEAIAQTKGTSEKSASFPVDTHNLEIAMSEITEQKPATATAKEEEPASEKEVINTFQNLRQEVQQLFTKINELDNEKAEHNLVIGASTLSVSVSSPS